MSELYVWHARTRPKVCGFTFLKGIDPQVVIDMNRGRTVDARDVHGATFQMNPAHPKETKLADQHYNQERVNVIGPRFSDFLRKQNIDGLELFPATILDLDGNVASTEYSLVHTTHIVDCIDTDASTGIRWSLLDPNMITSWDEIVLKEGVECPSPLFRPRHLESYYFISKELAEAIEDEDFLGVWVAPMDEFDA